VGNVGSQRLEALICVAHGTGSGQGVTHRGGQQRVGSVGSAAVGSKGVTCVRTDRQSEQPGRSGAEWGRVGSKGVSCVGSDRQLPHLVTRSSGSLPLGVPGGRVRPRHSGGPRQ